MAKRRVAMYLRVSTDGQSTDSQRDALAAVAAAAGWEVVDWFEDAGISGAKGRDQRPAFDRLCRGAVRREFDMVAAWSVDRLGRSLQDLVGFLAELRTAGVDLYLHVQGLDTSTPAGRAMYQMLGVFSEFERAMIQERVRAGLAKAKANGKRLGRRPTPPDVLESVSELLRGGASIRAAARAAGVSHGTVQKVAATISCQ